jgi:3-oxoacyl-[acyl-carrier protein] reductase
VAWATLSAAAELSPRGITVNAVDPGPTDTGWLTPDARAKIKSTSPLGGVGSPEEVAEVVRFLLSPAGRAISGQLLTCDGGRRALRP